MKDKIIEHIDTPELLEQLYQNDKKNFKKAFTEIYPEVATKQMADFWKARLEFGIQKNAEGDFRRKDVLFLIFSCIISAVLIKIPEIFGFNPDTLQFYEKNAALIVFFGLSAYLFLTRKILSTQQILVSLSGVYHYSGSGLRIYRGNLHNEELPLRYQQNRTDHSQYFQSACFNHTVNLPGQHYILWKRSV